MAVSVPTDINSELLGTGGIVAPAQAPGNIDGPWIDRTGFESASALGILGTATGAPVTQSLTLQVFDADDGAGTNALPLKPDGSHAAASVTGATASGAMTQLGVKFQNCRKWVKVRGVYANTGGATPKNDVAVALVLGGARETPTRGPNP
jgi:hypothetical protein